MQRTPTELTVFYSWQTDRPTPLARNFINDALDRAVKTLNHESQGQYQLVVDQDMRDTPGSPDIAHTIFQKIDHAGILVADVTIAGATAVGRKPTPNPNVLVELGYGARQLGWERTVMVMNEAYGGPADLPFDIRNRGTLRYRLEVGDDKAAVRQRLQQDLTARLRAIVSLALAASRPSREIENEIRQFIKQRWEVNAGSPGHEKYFLLMATPLVTGRRVVDLTDATIRDIVGNPPPEKPFRWSLACGSARPSPEGLSAGETQTQLLRLFPNGHLEFCKRVGIKQRQLDGLWERKIGEEDDRDYRSQLFYDPYLIPELLFNFLLLTRQLAERAGIIAPWVVTTCLVNARGVAVCPHHPNDQEFARWDEFVTSHYGVWNAGYHAEVQEELDYPIDPQGAAKRLSDLIWQKFSFDECPMI